MNRGFEIYRRLGTHLVDGWLASEVLEILEVLDSAQRSKGVSGAVAEIGVHHGRLFIGLKLLQQSNGHSVAIDLFGDQERNIDNSGKGDLGRFRRNVLRWSSLDGLAIHEGDSTKLTADKLRELALTGIRLFSVDGGHTDGIVFSDMNLAEVTLAQGGIVIADDVFNQEWPGVSTGTLRYLAEGGRLVPFAIGFNKVFFASQEYSDSYQETLRSNFHKRYLTFVKSTDFAGHAVLYIGRVPRQPRKLLGRNDTAKQMYRRIQECQHHR